MVLEKVETGLALSEGSVSIYRTYPVWAGHDANSARKLRTAWSARLDLRGLGRRHHAEQTADLLVAYDQVDESVGGGRASANSRCPRSRWLSR